MNRVILPPPPPRKKILLTKKPDPPRLKAMSQQSDSCKDLLQAANDQLSCKHLPDIYPDSRKITGASQSCIQNAKSTILSYTT